MGHIVAHQRAYLRLQKRLDGDVTGAPRSPAFTSILKLLYSPEEAELAHRLPSRPASLAELARKLGRPAAWLERQLDRMAQRGVVLDLSRGEERYYALPPAVNGFFKYTFMRAREDLPMAELARLFERYTAESDRFDRAAFRGRTQLGRALIREEALPVLPEGESVEVLDWERAGRIIRQASAVAVSLCSCRHKASHLGKACDRPQENCLTLNNEAEAMIRMGAGRRIGAGEALAILEEAKGRGLAQVGDNVQRAPTYICNCCGCCCGMLQAVRTFGIRHAVVTSNWIMQVDRAKCKGCGKCARACPPGAIRLVPEPAEGRPLRRAALDPNLCLGCGVCFSACANGGITFQPRPRRVYTPETLCDRVLAMAAERGKLAEVIFEQPERLSHRALKGIVRFVEHSPPFRAAMAIAPLRSAFLNRLVRAAGKSAGLKPLES